MHSNVTSPQARTKEDAPPIVMKCEAIGAARNTTQPFPGDLVQLNGMHRATRVRWFPCTLPVGQPLSALAALSMVCIFFLLHAPVYFRRSDAFGPSSPTIPMTVTAHRKASLSRHLD